MKLSPHYLRRYKDIALLMLKYGQPAAKTRFRFVESSNHGPNGDTDPDARALPDELERMGPTFVKLGQLLSSRADLLPERYLKALSRLQDKVKPVPFREIQGVVEAELKTKLNKAFSFFDPEPLAAASLGQVHRAALHAGRPVAVKVQRPNIGPQIQEDFAALEEIGRFLSRHTYFGQRYGFTSLLEEFENTLSHELDYQREAANMLTLSRNLAEFPRIRIPRPVPDLTTHRVLTMDFIDGRKITQLSPLAHLEIDGAGLAEELFKAYLQQILVDGMFHADPHAGNVFLTSDNRIALLDVGMVGHTMPSMREKLLKFLLAVSEGDGDDAAETAISIGAPGLDFDEASFRQKIAQLVADQQNASLKQIDVGKIVLHVARSAADTGVRVPTELSLLGKTLMQLDEVGRILAPEFDPNESIRRNASDILNQRLKSTFTEGKLFATLLEGKHFLGALPGKLSKILDSIGNAELNVNVKPSETEFLVESARKVANRITTGLVLAALIIGAALMMRVPTRFEILGYPGLAILCFFIAAGGGFWLLLSIIWQDHKTRLKSRG